MVKADPKRNYYADLEVQPGADTEDIRKQFLKLALKYHPDRNPGREAECVPKFQAIQAAHEVLGDPTERKKYDAERNRLNIYPNLARPNGPPRASYTATTNFPPPPRRTQPPESTPRRPTFTSTPSSAGASRFTNFPRPPPSARAARDDAEAKANFYNAWQHMNPGKHTTGAGTPPPPPPGTSRYRSASDQEDQAEKGRSAWENFNKAKPGMGRSKTTRTPKKSGFDPAADGDERQAGGASSYYTGPRYTDRPPPPPHVRSDVPPTPPRAPGVAPKARKPDPMDHFRERFFDDVPFAEGNRDRTPYASSSGERTFLGRSASVRSSPHRPESSEPPDPFRTHRHRSASPSSRASHPDEQLFSPKSQAPPPFPQASSARPRDRLSGNATKPFFMYSSSDEENDGPQRHRHSSSRQSETKPAPDQGRQYPDLDQRPKATPAPPSAKHDRRSPNPAAYPAQNGINGGTATPTNGMGQKSQSNMYATSFSSVQSRSPVENRPSYFPKSSIPWSDKWPFGSKKHAAEAPTSPPRLPYWAIPSSVSPAAKAANNAATPVASQQVSGNPSALPPDPLHIPSPLQKAPVTSRKVPGSSSVLPINPFSESEFIPTSEALADAAGGFPLSSGKRSGSANVNANNSFNFPFTDETFAPNQAQNLRSRSHEAVNTTFSPSEWDGKFTGAPDYFAQPPQTARKESRTRVSPTRGRTQSRPVPAPPPPPRSTEDPVSKPELRPPTNRAADASHNVSTESLSGGVRFSQEEWAKTFKEPSWVYPRPKAPSPTRPPSTGRKTKTPATRKASISKTGTTVPQPASASEAIDESEPLYPTTSGGTEGLYSTASRDSNAMDIDSESPRPFANGAVPPPPPGPPPATVGPRLVPVQPNRPEWRDTSSAQHDPKAPPTAPSPAESAVNLTDLKNVAPFTTSASGLQSTDDIASSLPFESKPSSDHPIKSFTPKELPLPPPPKAPAPPERLTQRTWTEHLSHFSAYMIEWNRFNRTMLNHFDARQASAEMLMSPVNPHHPMREGGGWLGALGEGEKGGFKSYLQALREDERVRMHWNVSCERHRDAVERLGALREKVMRLKTLPVA